MRIDRADPRSPEGRALLGASHAYLASLYPPEDNHYLSVEELAAPHIAFWIASDEAPLGCVALARMEGYGEVKSLWTEPAARGRGVGRALMVALEDEARAQGLKLLRLETGDTLDAAHALYGAMGWNVTGPFGDYREGPHSVFMDKRL